MRVITVLIYENTEQDPVVGHTFYGKTLADAKGNLNAHMSSDSFFRAAMTGQTFKGIKLTVSYREV